jgi:hypothetical protein
VTPNHLEILDDRFGSVTLAELFDYGPGGGLPSEDDRQQIRCLMDELGGKRDLDCSSGETGGRSVVD